MPVIVQIRLIHARHWEPPGRDLAVNHHHGRCRCLADELQQLLGVPSDITQIVGDPRSVVGEVERAAKVYGLNVRVDFLCIFEKG